MNGAMMSWQDSKWAIGKSAGSAGAKAVLLVLAEAAKDGRCFLSHAVIGERAEMDRRSVIRHLHTLEHAAKLIGRERRADNNGHRTTDLIVLRRGADQSDSLALGLGDSLTQSQDDNLALRTARQGDNNGAPKVTKTMLLSDSLSQDKRTNLESEPVVSLESAPSPRARKKAGAPLPPGFPDACALARMVERCKEAGVYCDPAEQAQRFRDHHEAKGTLSASWPASLNTWTSNHIKWSQERRLAPAGGHRPAQRSAIDWMMGGLE